MIPRMKAPSIAPSITTWATWTPSAPVRAPDFAPAPGARASPRRKRKSHSPAHAGGRAREQDRAPAAFDHPPRRLTAGQEPGQRRHFPNLGIDPRRRLDDGKTHIGAELNTRTSMPRSPARSARQRHDIGFDPSVEPKGVSLAALRADRLLSLSRRPMRGRRVTQTRRPSRAKARAIERRAPRQPRSRDRRPALSRSLKTRSRRGKPERRRRSCSNYSSHTQHPARHTEPEAASPAWRPPGLGATKARNSLRVNQRNASKYG